MTRSEKERLVQWANTSDANQPYQMVVYVKCADTAAPAHD